MAGNVRPVTDERDALIAFLDHQRNGIRATAYGLTEAQIRMAPAASELCIGGLIKHVAAVERGWMDTTFQRPTPSFEESVASYGSEFVVGDDETLESILADYEAAARETDELIAAVADLGQAVPVPDVPWFPKDVEAWSVRWVLHHLIQETARHAGHADIIRETIDGADMYSLLAAAENWPPMPYIEPWTPPLVAAG